MVMAELLQEQDEPEWAEIEDEYLPSYGTTLIALLREMDLRMDELAAKNKRLLLVVQKHWHTGGVSTWLAPS